MKLQQRIGQQSDAYVARRIAMDVLEMTKEQVVMSYHLSVESEALQHMDKMMAAYAEGKPLAYVLGYELFCGYSFVVDERVLIPRSETEELVMWAVAILSNLVESGQKVVLLDMGTGSWCVGLSIMDRIKKKQEASRRMKYDMQCILCDVSEAALRVAESNIKRIWKEGKRHERKWKDTIITKHVDVMKLMDDDQGLQEYLDRVDEVVIVANLPYIPTWYVGVEDDVRKREPSLALFSWEDGLEHYRMLIDWFFHKHMGLAKWSIWMEMMTVQASYLQQEVRGHGCTWNIHETLHENIVIVELVIEGIKE